MYLTGTQIAAYLSEHDNRFPSRIKDYAVELTLDTVNFVKESSTISLSAITQKIARVTPVPPQVEGEIAMYNLDVGTYLLTFLQGLNTNLQSKIHINLKPSVTILRSGNFLYGIPIESNISPVTAVLYVSSPVRIERGSRLIEIEIFQDHSPQEVRNVI
jgi:hypothetical protein